MTLWSKINGLRDIWQFDNRWHLIFTRLFFPNESLMFYKFKNVEFVTDHSAGDANGARELITTNMYKEFFPKLELPGKIKVLDLGANNGGFPLLLKTAGFVIEKLVCVELNPQTFSRLQFNIHRNFENNCFTVNAAITGIERIVEFEATNGGVGNNIYRSNSTGENTIKLNGITLNQIFSKFFDGQKVDLCKIDIESAEFEIFENDNHDQIKNCRFILMEIHHDDLKKDRKIVINRLNKIGFVEIDGDNKNTDTHFVHLFKNESI